ncbi:MFS transporter, partial [Alicyclobacillus hesperidum]
MNSQSRVGHRFIVLVSSQVLSQLGNNFFSLALLWYVLKITGSRSDVAIMAALQVFPNVFSLFAGTFADRMNRWNLMIITDISRFAIAGLIAGLGFGHLLSIWILGGLVFLLQLTGTFFTPAEMAVFPSMVSQEALA